MNIYEKLQEARCRFHESGAKKSGRNAHAKYEYFELCDIIPPVNAIFRALKMTSSTSFTPEIAIMEIIDCEKPEDRIVITSPMSTAKLPACHEVQNLGAVQTYLRRYLWQAALEIVECDALDAVTGSEGDKRTGGKPAQGAQPAASKPAVSIATPEQMTALYELARIKGRSAEQVNAKMAELAIDPKAITMAQYEKLHAGYARL